jgi:hypothetical protein
MHSRFVIAVLAVCVLAGCPKSDKSANKGKTKEEREVKPTTDNAGDVAFQAFVGRLRIAVQKRDRATLASMMTHDFGYRWDKGPDGESPFTYWDRMNLWGELAALLRERWVPYEGFMVVPPQFPANPELYNGYRAGVNMVEGSWRLAYFVSPPPSEQ